MSRARLKKAISRPSTPKETKAGSLPKPEPPPWSDWIWSEDLRLYYRARKIGDDWQYEYAGGPAPYAIECIELPPYPPLSTPFQPTQGVQELKYKYVPPEPQLAVEPSILIAPVGKEVLIENTKAEDPSKSKVHEDAAKKASKETTLKKTKTSQSSRPSTPKKESEKKKDKPKTFLKHSGKAHRYSGGQKEKTK